MNKESRSDMMGGISGDDTNFDPKAAAKAEKDAAKEAAKAKADEAKVVGKKLAERFAEAAQYRGTHEDLQQQLADVSGRLEAANIELDNMKAENARLADLVATVEKYTFE